MVGAFLLKRPPLTPYRRLNPPKRRFRKTEPRNLLRHFLNKPLMHLILSYVRDKEERAAVPRLPKQAVADKVYAVLAALLDRQDIFGFHKNNPISQKISTRR
jgi:hypothetical protein